MCRDLKDKGSSGLESMEDVKLKHRLEEVIMKPKPLLTTKEGEKYQGKFVALRRGGKREVLASGESYKKVVETAQRAAVAFFVIPVRMKPAIYTH